MTVVVAALTCIGVTAACGRAASPVAGSSVGPAAVAPTSAQLRVTPQVNSFASAAQVEPDMRVGAIFLGGDSFHSCSASVLNSSTGDLILTAAHCLADGVETTFVPGFRDTVDAPWRVDTVYLDPRWLATEDPQADFAVARVSRDDGASVQAAAGGGLALGMAPAPGITLTVTGYPMGTGGGPFGCQGTTAPAQDGFPALPCAGVTDGFSGAPWIVGATVQGVVGGLDGGGCDDDVSFSPRFDARTGRLLARAEARGPGDAAPVASAGDC